MDQTNEQPQWLTNLLNQQNQQLSALAEQQANQVAVLSERLEASQKQVNELATRQASYEATQRPPANSDRLTPSSTSQSYDSVVRQPKPTLSDPKRYDHSDKTLYPQFAGLLRAKVKHDGYAIGNEEKQAWYMFGRLEGAAARRIFPWIDAADKKGDLRTKDLLEQMDAAFQDPRAKEKALSTLNCTKQGNTPLNEFLSQFDQLLLEAGGWDWDDTIKKGFLKDAITTRLLSALVGTEEKSSYGEFCNQLRRTTDQLEEVREKSTGRFTGARWGRKSREKSPRLTVESDAMDWEAAVATAVRAAMSVRTKDSQGALDNRLSRHKQQGACWECGKEGHFARDCHTKEEAKPRKTSSGNKTRVAAVKSKKAKVARPREPDSYDEGGDELSSSLSESSGKE
jgi:Zinc knuckle